MKKILPIFVRYRSIDGLVLEEQWVSMPKFDIYRVGMFSPIAVCYSDEIVAATNVIQRRYAFYGEQIELKRGKQLRRVLDYREIQ